MLVTTELQTEPIRVSSYRCDAGPDAQGALTATTDRPSRLLTTFV